MWRGVGIEFPASDNECEFKDQLRLLSWHPSVAAKWLPQNSFKQLLGTPPVLLLIESLLFLNFRLKKAAALINGLESAKFAKVLSRVLQKVHLKVRSI